MADTGVKFENVDGVGEEAADNKRQKLDSTAKEATEGCGSYNDNLISLESFKITRVLTENPQLKNIVLETTVEHAGTTNKAVLFLEKAAFASSDVDHVLSSACTLKKAFTNDVYGNFLCFPPSEANAIKVTLVHPASEKHIQKYLPKKYYMVDETPELYENVVKPHILECSFDLQWVYNILDHIKEKERIVYEDPDPELGFTLLPDLKWDGQTVANLYLICLSRKKHIKSLRDLNQDSLPMLKNILKQGSKAIEDKYGLPASQQRIYIHYQPSYYHLHIHFTNLNFSAPGSNTECSTLLRTIINNIELLPDYYQRATLPFQVSWQDSLFEKLKAKASGKMLKARCEWRPLLGVANCILQFEQPICQPVVNVQSDSVLVSINGREIVLSLPPDFLLVPGSLLSAAFDENCLSFRVAIAPRAGQGSHSTQVLDITNICFPLSSFSVQKTQLLPSEPYTLKCSHCQTLVAQNLTFKEVMDLPFDDWEEVGNYDFFCHAHNHAGPTGPKVFKLDLTDYCLIGSSFILFSALPEAKIAVKDAQLFCHSCQSEIGLVENKLWKVWDHSVFWQNSSGLESSYKTPLNCVLTFIHASLQCGISASPAALHFLGGDQILELNVLDKNSLVLEGSSDQPFVVFKPRLYTNVLYRVHSVSQSSVASDAQVVRVSLAMFEAVVKCLIDSCKSKVDGRGFQMGSLPNFCL